MAWSDARISKEIARASALLVLWLIAVALGCSYDSRQDSKLPQEAQKTRRIQFEPEKETMLQELLGFEGCVVSFAGGLPDVWIETTINDQGPQQNEVLSLREENLSTAVVSQRAGTIVLQWTKGSDEIIFRLRLNTDLGVHRTSVVSVPAKFSEDDQGFRQANDGHTVGLTSWNSVPLDQDLTLHSWTFYPAKTSIAEATNPSWDPKNGSKVRVTLKARFASGKDQHPVVK